MKKIALLNGFIEEINEKQNILIENKKIQGLGYIPDDEDSQQIDLTNQHILNNTISIGPLINWNPGNHKKLIQSMIEHGTNFTAVLVNQENIEKINQYKNIIPILNIKYENLSKIKMEELQNLGIKGLYGIQFKNPNITSSLKIAHQNKLPILIDHKGSELIYILEEHRKSPCKIILCLQDLELSLEIINQYRPKDVVLTVPATWLKTDKNTIIKKIKKNQIHFFINDLEKESFLPFIIEELKNDFSLNEILKIIKTAHPCFGSQKEIKLTSTAHLTILKPQTTPVQLCYFISGNNIWRYKNKLNVI